MDGWVRFDGKDGGMGESLGRKTTGGLLADLLLDWLAGWRIPKSQSPEFHQSDFLERG